MTKLVAALAACALLGCGKKTSEPAKTEAAKAESTNAGPQIKRAKLAVDKLAFEGYPMWAASNPDKACPDKIEDLGPDVKDPWGSAYQLFCGPNAPAGVRGVGIVSNGPDQKQGTDDDIRSWE
jgi:hypothetical protein